MSQGPEVLQKRHPKTAIWLVMAKKVKSFSIIWIFSLFVFCFLSQGCSLLERVINKDEVKEREVLGYVYEYKYNAKVAKLQRILKELNYDISAIDGKMGDKTRGVIKEFQKDREIDGSGYVDKKTWTELNNTYERKFLSFEEITIEKIQAALRNAGFEPGPIDGKLGPRTKKAIKKFQKSKGLSQTAESDRKTWNYLKEYLLKKSCSSCGK